VFVIEWFEANVLAGEDGPSAHVLTMQSGETSRQQGNCERFTTAGDRRHG
jgi:hypothetical protein